MKEQAPLRPGKDDDQEKTLMCYRMLTNLILSHPEAEVTLWMSALLRVLARAHMVSGCTHEEFKEEINRGMDFYKEGWIND